MLYGLFPGLVPSWCYFLLAGAWYDVSSPMYEDNVRLERLVLFKQEVICALVLYLLNEIVLVTSGLYLRYVHPIA